MSICKAQFFCPNILRVALQLLGLKAGPKDKTIPSCPNSHFPLISENLELQPSTSLLRFASTVTLS